MTKALPEQSADPQERAMLMEMLDQAHAMVTQLETALWRLSAPEARDTNPVRYWRKQRRISQTELAKMVGVTSAAICRIEHAEHFAARPDTRDRICAALDIPVEWLNKAVPEDSQTVSQRCAGPSGGTPKRKGRPPTKSKDAL
ncbi:DNA-binding Xre family transcriptional regulator [Sphingomonas vulcanisoli]|uniref:DNA-binding Xre family transcriptional regulator n=1 Tax=Sphingomonas vulcanisoli TaxID=1658060 RepID=A0ABX0TVL0_9SPHN|nr:helix-turn-helix domain-containing protein [Sphingomonas vulcanisoli]NIJ08400.1 DNA-binding Xre family transcriptional regulator [Sphingomonas vulcanisoli]